MINNVIVKKSAWQKAIADSLQEVAVTLLGFEGSSVLGYEKMIPENVTGAHVAMVSLRDSLNIGIFSDEAGCQTLARALLAMESSEDIGTEDMRDAMGEIINIIAGGVKRRMVEDEPTIKVGLPVFLSGMMCPLRNVDSSIVNVTLGPVSARLFLILDAESV